MLKFDYLNRRVLMLQTSPRPPRRVSVLLLAALMAALALPCFAAAAPSTPAPAVDAGFVASLAAPAAPTLPPAPTFLQTTGSDCTSDAQCPTGQLCCRACGFVGCTRMACFPPMHGHCPFFP
jgi:hypothetical protein